MRLEPIERPKGLLLKIAYWLSRRQMGAVISPLKVVYARSTRIARAGFGLVRTMESGLSLDPELKLLVVTQSSLLNGCGFCADLHAAQAVQAKIGREKWADLTRYAESPHFSERERAALAYTEEATRHRHVVDATFETLRKHFDEREIVELTWLNAVGNYFNLLAMPLGLESDGLVEIAVQRSS
jgi:AhpD family alkylhydroperoxidase